LAISAFVTTMKTYGISIIEDRTTKTVTITKKNATISFVTLAEISTGKYDYIDATAAVLHVDFSTATKEFLTATKKQLDICCQSPITIMGFLSDFETQSVTLTRYGSFRNNPNTQILEVYTDTGWVQLQP